jgi:hypothetical protein
VQGDFIELVSESSPRASPTDPLQCRLPVGPLANLPANPGTREDGRGFDPVLDHTIACSRFPRPRGQARGGAGRSNRPDCNLTASAEDPQVAGIQVRVLVGHLHGRPAPHVPENAGRSPGLDLPARPRVAWCGRSPPQTRRSCAPAATSRSSPAESAYGRGRRKRSERPILVCLLARATSVACCRYPTSIRRARPCSIFRRGGAEVTGLGRGAEAAAPW